MKDDQPVMGGVLWGAIGFAVAIAIIVAYQLFAPEGPRLDDHVLDEKARRGEL